MKRPVRTERKGGLMSGKAKRDLMGAILFFIAGVIFFFNEKGRYMAFVFFALSLIFFALSRGNKDKDDY